MAATEPTDKEKTTPAVQAETNVEQPDAAKTATAPKITGIWWVVVALLAFFATVGFVAAGFALQRSVSSDDDWRSGSRGMMAQDSDYTMQRGGGEIRGGMMGRGGYESGNDMNTTRVNGVVTSVDGSIITVAGNGQTTKVVVTDDTTYVGDDKPAAVNDTIMVVGTKQGDTFTATRVMLQRQ